MLIYHNGSVARNVAGNLFLPLFINKTAKAPHINVVPRGHIGFYNAKECLHGSRDICLVYSGAVCNLVDDVGFGHCKCCLDGYYFFGTANLEALYSFTKLIY